MRCRHGELVEFFGRQPAPVGGCGEHGRRGGTVSGAYGRSKREFKAVQGDAVLRSKGEAVEPEREAAQPKVKDWSRHGREQFLTARADHAAKERALLEREDLSAKGKKPLQAFLRTERIAAEAKAQGYDLGDIARRIDGKGVVIFTLASGGSIRDTGRELYFSAHDEKAHGIALAYAALKWGKNITQEQGKILFRQAPEIQREQARGWNR